MCPHFGVPVILVIATTLACAFEIPVELRSRQGPIPFRRGGSFAGRAAKTTTGDISEQEGDFTVKVSIGTPPQNFRLLVSHDDYVTYVLGSSCDTGVCPYRARFDGSKSSTYAGLPKDYFFVGNYDTNGGYVSPAKDDIMIGDVIIRQAVIGVAVNNSLYPFVRQDEVHYDGVLGLGNFLGDNIFKNLTVPILETAFVQKAVGKSLYTIWLQRQGGGNCEYSKAFLPVVGSLTLGDYNKEKCDHTINWHPLRSRFGDDIIGEYATRVDAVSYGSHVYFLDEHIIWTAKFDVRDNIVLYAPSKIADDIAYRAGAQVQIKDRGERRFYPISCKATPDDVKVFLDRQEYVIPGKYLVNRFYYPSTCSLSLIASNYFPFNTSYQFVIGTPFLREYCQTYDAHNNRIGFSKNTDTAEMQTQLICSGSPTLVPLFVVFILSLAALL